jgi:tetratricopeptide (TPR) repeat protein
METKDRRPLRAAVLALAALGLWLALPLAAQKDFNQSEKETIEKYKRARVHFLKGGEYLKKGKLDKAQQAAQAALAVFPEYAEARLLQAELGYQRAQYEEALKEIEAAKTNFRQFSKLYEYSYLQYLDLLRQERDRVDKHINDLSMQLTISPPDDDTRQKIEDTISKDKQSRDSLDTKLRSPIPEVLDVPADYHYTHGNILFKMRRFNEAREQYLAAVKADPRHANAWNNLISILFAARDVAGAAQCVREAEANGVKLNEKLKQAVLEAK